MEPEAADRVGFMSKAEILRVIISERLTAAAQEIFAVVERTLAGYEEEVSGCRQEIDLQRNQLGVLLHRPVKVETEDDDYMIPISEPTAEEASEGGGGGDEDVLHTEEEQQQQKFELSVEDDGSMALLCYTGVETHDEEEDEENEEDEEEEQEEEGGEDKFSEQLGLTPVEDQDETTELDYEEVSRSLSPTVQSDRRSVGRPRVSDLRSHVDLRICILENSHIEILSTRVFQTYPMRELRCPCGLQEADFLDLLRSTFPQLAANEPFDIFWSDRSRLLKPLKVKALTPEEISSTIKSTGAGKSPLYIRLKTMSVSPTSPPSAADSPHNYVHLRICILKNPKINVILPRGFKNCPVQELKCPRGLPEADFLDLLRSTFPQLAGDKPFDLFTTDRSRMLRPLRVETLTPEKIAKTIKSTGAGKSALYIRLKTLSVPTKSHPSAANSSHNHVTLRICILDNPKINVILPRAFKKWPVQELKCPRGLQEADFLDLLRSTFPQLEGNKPFDVFTIDRNRTLKPLRVEALTPEKIGKTIKSRGKSALYIRLKPFDKEMKPIHPPQRKDAAAENSHSKLNTSAQSGRRRPGRPRRSDPQSYVDLSLRLLEDPQVNVLSDRVFREYPLQELKCPCGLQEPDFVDLLRSTFPQLAGDKPFDILTSDRSRTLYPLRMKNLTPEGVYRTMRSLRHSGIYIRLKAPEKKPNAVAAKDSPSTSNPGRRRTSPVQQQERNGVDFPFIFSASEQRGKYTEKAEDGSEDHEWLESPSLWSLPLSETDQDEEEVDGRGDNWEPPKADENLRNKKPEKRKNQQIDDSAVQTKRRRIRSSLQVLTGRNNNGPLTCRVCGIVRRSTRMLIKHSWRHVDDAGRLCGVCGEQSTSAELLRVHLQSHQKTHSCNICGKSLLSVSGLSGHLARHRGEKPHKCKICHKAFAEKWTLNNHMWIHVKDKPHKCDICQTSYASKQKLRLHRVKHVEEKPYSCSTCTSSFSTLKTLSKHMLTHSSSSGEKPYACDICSKRYSLNKRLQSHLRSHTSQWPNGCSTCNKQFTCKAKLVMHMRNHTS